ncbi:MAG: hypothetical protein E7265_11525 [Lachnospiraceae bacterium]|nr:hypothetical protein [Lachnospiraceae bacterium]
MSYVVDDIFDKLVDIEGAASRIIQGSEDQKVHKKAEYDQKVADYDKNLEAGIEKELSDVRKRLQEEEQMQLDALKKEAMEEEAKLDALYAKEHDNWVESIFSSIVSL